jgi:hypothetical protein
MSDTTAFRLNEFARSDCQYRAINWHAVSDGSVSLFLHGAGPAPGRRPRPSNIRL